MNAKNRDRRVPVFLKVFFFWTAVSIFFSIPSFAFDHSKWDLFLKQYVNEKGEVDYPAIVKDRTLLDAYGKDLQSISDEMGLGKEWPREERLALWLNAFHFGLIHAVVDHYPIKSVQDIPGVWEDSFTQVGGHTYSLNTIRNDKLISQFHDEKIHMALSCAAQSCPKMRREAFTPERVDGQLFLAAREFVNDPDMNWIKPGEKKIQISKMLEWYAKDFKLNFGVMDNDRGLSLTQYAVLSFLSYYLESAEKKEFLEQGNYKIKYLPFNWALNEWHPVKS